MNPHPLRHLRPPRYHSDCTLCSAPPAAGPQRPRAIGRSHGGAAGHYAAWFADRNKADHSGAALVQRYPAPSAADPIGNAGHRAEPQRSCSATTPSQHVGRRPRLGNCRPQHVLLWSCLVLRDLATPTADLSRDTYSGGAAGATCLSKHLKVPWTADLDGAAGSTGQRSSITLEADHVSQTKVS